MATIWDEMRRMQHEMDSLFENFFGRTDPDRKLLPGESTAGSIAPFKGYRQPLVDMYETDKDIVITAELPGMNKEDIKISVTDGSAEIKAETKTETKMEDKKKGSYHYERSQTGFYRKLPLPEGVSAEKASAEYKDGVLQIKMPKSEQKKKGTEIKIK